MDVARQVLEGKLSILLAARELKRLLRDAGLSEDDEDLVDVLLLMDRSSEEYERYQEAARQQLEERELADYKWLHARYGDKPSEPNEEL